MAFITLQPDVALPSQDFLKVDTVQHILRCYQENRLDRLPPPPLVRLTPTNDYVAIDGHNLLAVNGYLGKPTVAYLAASAHDYLPGDDAHIAQRNRDLEERFDSCLVEMQRLQGMTFADLRRKYPSLFSENVSLEYQAPLKRGSDLV